MIDLYTWGKLITSTGLQLKACLATNHYYQQHLTQTRNQHFQ